MPWVVAFVLGAAVGALVALALRRGRAARSAARPGVPAPHDLADAERLVASPGATRELIAAWVQFLRSEVADAANALNNRLAVLKGIAQTVVRKGVRPELRDELGRLEQEVSRAGAITAGLLRRVNSFAPDTIPEPFVRLQDGPTRPADILVVEDDTSNREVICRLLDGLGHRTTAARDGLEAFAALGAAEFDCVIADIRMPGLGGKGLYEQVEEKMPNIASRFVFVTGDFTRPETRTFLETTGCPVIPKPYEVDALLTGVAAALERAGIIFRS